MQSRKTAPWVGPHQQSKVDRVAAGGPWEPPREDARVPTVADWSVLVDALRQARRVLILAHINPDADTMGSSLALASALSRTGVEVQVAVGMPAFEMPTGLAWLPGQEFLVPAEQVRAPVEVALAIDCSAIDRLGTLADTAAAAELFAAIDHHASYDGFASVAIVDPLAPAAGVLVAELIDRLGLEWTIPVAVGIYAAISSDTGSFRYPATTADTHRLAAALLDRGIDQAEISRRIFADRALGLIRIAGQTMHTAEYFPSAVGGGGALIGVIDAKARERYGVSYDEVESVIGDLTNNGVAEVTAIVKQDDSGGWKVSTRSRGNVDVAALCLRLGGGGHRAAAGYTAAGNLAETLAQLHAELGIDDGDSRTAR
ncbi:MAG: bifunctional oligoribonuclease and phosphatase NrnA [Actinomycetota bacterium]|nr:bifunctional oligoribonuclease and phosphatase NrnA [Actinomycetota bacterium]